MRGKTAISHFAGKNYLNIGIELLKFLHMDQTRILLKYLHTNKVAKKPRVCGYYPRGRFAKCAVSEESFMSTHYIMYPKL